MELVLAYEHLGVGGTESYQLTVAAQLQRLGHGITIYARRSGPMARVASSRGVRVAIGTGGLPESCDVVYAQDSATAYDLAGRYPQTPQVFHLGSELVDLQLPPGINRLSSATVVLSERCLRRARALAVAQRIVRLRQPVDTERFAALDVLRPRPRRALLLGNWLRGGRRDLLVRIWAEHGVECVQAGVDTRWAPKPEEAIADADIVVAKGRAALEGMACGKAVYLYDIGGADGWVTPPRYEALEADGFAGGADRIPASAARLRSDLQRYSPAMGVANRDLAVAHHGARRHAEQLAELFRQLSSRGRITAPFEELARLVRVQWQTESTVLGLTAENQRLNVRLLERERELEAARAELAELRVASDVPKQGSPPAGAHRRGP